MRHEGYDIRLTKLIPWKQKTGENLFDAINRMRIDRAKEYIGEQKLRIYEIAERVGFEDTAEGRGGGSCHHARDL